ncbi:MAG TPA: glucose 1-dehydrogenase [Candidatus Dormibacteraeota bacterium]|nr:glucose 1-dehydrogenase [Candidatus Dormibacteraeota bacterium]
MKAIAANPNRRVVELVERDAPRIGAPTQARLRMLDVGVCGTDREICTFQYGTPPCGSEHLVLGHESLAEVVEIGPEVTRVKPGDLVVTMVRRPCAHDHCQPCRGGRQDFCSTGDFHERGIGGLHGFMTEYVVDEERYMHVVPRALRDVAVLVEPLTIAEKALIQVEHVQQRLPWACAFEPGGQRQVCHRAVVIGAGPVGLLGAMALVNAGFETWVYSRERVPNPKAEVVTRIGAHYVSAEESTVEQLAAQVGNIDLVYEATGASSVAFEVMKVLGVNGIFIFTGVPGRKAPITVDTEAIMRNLVLKNQVVFGTVNAGHDAFAASIADLSRFRERWPEAVASLITGRHPVEKYHDLLLGPLQGIKNVLQFAA